MKKCSKCHNFYPANTEHFYNQRATSDNLTSWCRACDRAASTERKRRMRREGILPKVDREKAREYTKKWRLKNIEKARALNRETQKRRRENGAYRATSAVSRRIREVISRNFKGGFRHLPYSPKEFKAHIERQFSGQMSWDNYGSLWHIDHIVPVSSFNFDGPACEGFQRCWALSNLRPLLASENLSKGSKLLHLV